MAITLIKAIKTKYFATTGGRNDAEFDVNKNAKKIIIYLRLIAFLVVLALIVNIIAFVVFPQKTFPVLLVRTSAD